MADTDWPQILGLYDLLEGFAPSPLVTLNRAVAAGHGGRARRPALDLLAELDADARLAGHHRLDAVRAHLLEMAGDAGGAAGRLPGRARRGRPEPARAALPHRPRHAAGRKLTAAM